MEPEDLIVLGAPADTLAAGGETSTAADTSIEGQPAGDETNPAAPGSEQADPAAAPKPDAPKGDGEDGGEERPKKRSGIQRMQDQITRLKTENASLRSAAPAAGGDRAAVIEKEIGAPPKEADFEDYAAYDRAVRQYDVKLALAEQRAADREADASRRQSAAKEEAQEAFHDRCDEAREKLPDFDKVLEAARGRQIAAHVSDLVVESEKGGMLAYYLAKNPDVLTKLNGMSERAAAKAVGALEQRLTLAKPKTATAAPTPAKPVSGSSKPSSPDSDLDAWLAKKYG